MGRRKLKTGTKTKVLGLKKKAPHKYYSERASRAPAASSVTASHVPAQATVRLKSSYELLDFEGRKFYRLTKEAYPEEYKYHVEDALFPQTLTPYLVELPSEQTVMFPLPGEVILTAKGDNLVSIRVDHVDAHLERSIGLCWVSVVDF